MSDREPAARPDPSREGLCARCTHRRQVVSDRGSRFVLCALSRQDDRFARYPRLPVLSCSGFDPGDEHAR